MFLQSTMGKILRYSLLCLAMGLAYAGMAQQQAMYTQYMFNGLLINPAYAGSQESFTATGLFRKQWVGINGAPETQTFSAHSPIDKLRNKKRPGSKVSLGLTFINDKVAITNQTGLYGVYAYRLRLVNRASLSMGIQAGISQMRIKYSELSLNDPSFLVGDVTEWAPNFGGGIYYNTQRFYAGFSMPHILHKTRDQIGASTTMEPQCLFAMGYVFDLQSPLKLKPNLLVKSIKGNPVQFDVNCSLFLSDRFEVGASWRSFESFSSMIRVSVNPRFALGYAYDMPSESELSRQSNGSHEMMVSYRTPLKRLRSINPRYF
jgi:type IX secretion system PorP/SprF family membrane protein